VIRKQPAADKVAEAARRADSSRAAKKAKLDKDPVTAKVYLDLGLAQFAAGDAEGAKTAFAEAAKIDPKIQIDAAYKSAELSKLLDEARSEAGGGSAGGGTTGATGNVVEPEAGPP